MIGEYALPQTALCAGLLTCYQDRTLTPVVARLL
jgi:hypothetical protein